MFSPSAPARRTSALALCKRRLSLAALAVLTLAGPVFAQLPVSMAWDSANDGVTVGHQVLVGIQPNNPLVTLDVGPATRVVLPLPPGGVYYVAVRGYTGVGLPGPSTPETVVDLANAPGAPVGLRSVLIESRQTK